MTVSETQTPSPAAFPVGPQDGGSDLWQIAGVALLALFALVYLVRLFTRPRKRGCAGCGKGSACAVGTAFFYPNAENETHSRVLDHQQSLSEE